LCKRIRYPGGQDWYEVIGWFRDERHDGLDQDVKPIVFLPYSTAVLTADINDLRSLRLMSIILRGPKDPAMLAGAARAIVRGMDADIPMYALETMTGRLERSLWTRRAYSWLFGTFAVIAILLAAAGVYGIVSYVVSQRTPEIAVRAALGARPAQVLKDVLLGGMALVSIGVAAGLLGALWATNVLRTLLFGVSSRDPVIYASVVAGVIVVGLLANFLPARRAATVDPVRVLRSE